MKIAGIVALALGVVLAIPLILAAAYEGIAAVRPPGADSALLQFDMTAPAEWSAVSFVHESLEPFPIGLETARTTPPGGWNDPPGGKGTLEVEVVDPAGAVAYRNEVDVDALGPMADLSTSGITTIHPKRAGRWTLRGRVLRGDPTFRGSVVEVSVNRRTRMESDAAQNVILAGGGVAGIARPAILLLVGASLLIGARRK